MGRKARTCTIIMLLSVIFMPLVPLPVNSVCPSSPGVTITIAQPKQIANVAPGHDGIVTFTGNVEAQVPWKPNSHYLVVHLSPDANGWPTSKPPPLIFTRQTKMKTFSVDVYVPTGTSGSYQGQFSMGGTWRFQNTTIGGTLYFATAIILVQQYHLVVLETPKRYIQVEPGQRLRTQVELENRGNGNEEFSVGIKNRGELENRGWKIDLTPEDIAIDERNSTRLDLELSSSKNMEPGFYNLSIGIEFPKTYREDQVIYVYDCFIEVREREMLGVRIGVWIIFEYSLIILLGMVTSFIVMVNRRLKGSSYWKLLRTLV